jgi:hypothetical protein
MGASRRSVKKRQVLTQTLAVHPSILSATRACVGVIARSSSGLVGRMARSFSESTILQHVIEIPWLHHQCMLARSLAIDHGVPRVNRFTHYMVVHACDELAEDADVASLTAKRAYRNLRAIRLVGPKQVILAPDSKDLRRYATPALFTLSGSDRPSGSCPVGPFVIGRLACTNKIILWRQTMRRQEATAPRAE